MSHDAYRALLAHVLMWCLLMACAGCLRSPKTFHLAPERKVVLMTGSASGIGEAVCELFLERGHVVYGADIQTEKNQYLQSHDGGHAVEMDVRDEAAIARVVAQIIAEQGHLDVVVNNAGYGAYGAIEAVPMAEVERQFDVNVFGYVRVVQAVLPQLRAQGYGRIFMVSSVVGEMAPPMMGYYAASKHAVEALSDALRGEVEPLGLEVIKVQPGPVNTRFDEVALARLRATTTPEEYAALRADFEGYLQDLYTRVEGPQSTAEQIVDAALARRTPTEIRSTWESKLAVRANRLMRERRFDRFMRRQYRRGARRWKRRHPTP